MKDPIVDTEVGGYITLDDMTDFPKNDGEWCYIFVSESEVLKVKGVDGTKLEIMERGQQVTDAQPHEAGAVVSKLSFSTDYNQFRGNQHYIYDAMVNKIADTINTAGMSLSDMDGLEDSDWSHSYHMHEKTMDWWYNAVEDKDNLKSYSSNMTQWGWHIFTAQTWGEKYEYVIGESEYNYRLGKNYDYYVRNFFPATMGLCGFRADYTEEDAHWMGAKAAAFNTQLNIADEDDFFNNPEVQYDPLEIFDIFREWTTARDVNAFTMEQRVRMAPYKSHWLLTTVEPGIEWGLQEIEKVGYDWKVVSTETAKAPGVTNLARGENVKISASTNLENAELLNDKDLEKLVDLGTGAQYLQFDLGSAQDIDQIRIWHDYEMGKRYNDVVVQLSNDPEFKNGVTTVFNNDTDNSLGLGTGNDEVYAEPFAGKTIEFDTVNAQYVRLWSNGNDEDETNSYAEVQILNGKRTYPEFLPRNLRNGLENVTDITVSEVTSSTAENSYNVIDNDLNTAWTSGNEQEEWVALKLNSYDMLSIGNIAVRWGNDNVKSYKVQV